MAEGWRYFATRLDGNGGEESIDTDLPLSGVEITNNLSQANTLNATVPVEVARLQGSEYSLFVPWQTCVYAELDGLIRGGGIVTKAPPDDATIAVECVGFAGYPTGIPYDVNSQYVQTDPLTIARGFWTHLQRRPGFNIGLDLNIDPATSPVRLGTESEDVAFDTSAGESVEFTAGPWTMTWWDTLDMGSRWDDLTKDAGLDWWEEHRWVGEKIRHTLHINYPTTGRPRPDLRFVVGENITDVPQVEVDGDNYASEVIVLGAGEGRDMIRASWPISHPGRLSRPMTVTDTAIRSTKDAQARAEKIAKSYVGDQDVTSLVVANHPNAPLGSWSLGDTITVQGSGVGWAGDLYMSVRITGYQLSPDSGDTATLTVSRSDRISNG